LSSKFIVAIGLAALADWLIYGQWIGISIVVLAIAVSCGSLLANFTAMNRRRALPAGVLACERKLPVRTRTVPELQNVLLTLCEFVHNLLSLQEFVPRGPNLVVMAFC